MANKKTFLYHRLRDHLSRQINMVKGGVDKKDALTPEEKAIHKAWWVAINSDELAEKALTDLVGLLELYLFIPCCHTTGEHDPEHFAQRRYICKDQMAEAFKRFCSDLGVNPTVRSKPGCSWCAEYPEYRAGEGLRLFPGEATEDKKPDA